MQSQSQQQQHHLQDPFVVLPTFHAEADNSGDVLVIVQECDFYVHRDLLWFSSSFFRDLLQENWAEGLLADAEEARQEPDVDDDDRSPIPPSEAVEKMAESNETIDSSGPASLDASPFALTSSSSQLLREKDKSNVDDPASNRPSPGREGASPAGTSVPPTPAPAFINRSLLLSPSSRSDNLPLRETDRNTATISPTLSLQNLQLLETPPGSPRRRMLLASSSRSVEEPSPDRDRFRSFPAPVIHQRHRPISKPRGVIVTVLRLEEEQPSTFQSFLCAVYPHLRLAVSWRNIGNLMTFSDKYGVNPSLLYDPCRTFLEASLTGNPIEAMRLAEHFGLQGVFKEASKHVLDLYAVWSTTELSVLSKETLIKLERKRSWFLERLLKLSVSNPQRDFECQPLCPSQNVCAEALQARWNAAYAASFRFGPPQPTVVWKHLRELEGGGPPLTLSACENACRVWVQTRFDRMFELGLAGPRTRSQFLYILLDDTVLAKKLLRRRIRADQLPAPSGSQSQQQQQTQAQAQIQQPGAAAVAVAGGAGGGGGPVLNMSTTGSALGMISVASSGLLGTQDG
ncbi:unnamed protein product [Tilletia controversa]|uniref:BTB domain-containing protein n=1 Tax=Tilletia controversa TaxID=13291 RepID=A0A8X7MY90_9BASI|nr:hypothetical protein CF328_g1078 [Tilletia controversa]KAE8253345.1 hypothetical protein A4X06_0g1524 [Tilletia controversa]CAD6907489.1 unnamed protein product [Tilletia controversa]CAD6973207.1 unnamed protein product [Tilletia controversa]CAD6976140.1 unnamed protein product [Tilletia controversa]